MLVKVKINDTLLMGLAAKHSAPLLIRDTENPLLQCRFHKCLTKASWRILYRNKWIKVAEWPEVKTKDIRFQFPVLIGKIRDKQEAKFTTDCFNTVGELLNWYVERTNDNANLKKQTIKDINSTVNCHLMPRLEKLVISDITRNQLDKVLVWPLQKTHAKGTVAKIFRTLKAAFVDAADLYLLPSNPIANMKISDFGDFSDDPKDAALNPRLVQPLLDELPEQTTMVRVLVMVMLCLGTRIGETLKATWTRLSLVDPSVWDIPAKDTKTNKKHVVYLPSLLVGLLKEWRAFQIKCGYKGVYVFPNIKFTGAISYDDMCKLIHAFSVGQWSSHDLRRVARDCWGEQGVDFMVAEKMLNHSLGKTAEAYIDSDAQARRLTALNNHCAWLHSLNEQCFMLNPEPTPSNLTANNEHNKNAV